MNDTRPEEYLYYKQLLNHIKEQGKDESIFTSGEFIYPRQFEIHLPASHLRPCNCKCVGCAGLRFIKDLGNWEIEGLELLNNLKGAIPYHIYGGAYTEPTMNPYFMTYLSTTKKYNNHFGIHTNGVLLKDLEDNYGFLTELNRASTDKVDYLSISIDAGTPENWAENKRVKDSSKFYDIIEGVGKATKIMNDNSHAIRLCYLISPVSGNIHDFVSIINYAKELNVDSLRFSIPFAPYNQSFDKVRDYKSNIETPGNDKYYNMLKNYLSESKDERPYIFYTGPEFTDIDRFTFNKCFYFLYQITAGADGWFYKCSTTATPTAKQCRLGKITGDLEEFKKIIMKNADYKNFNCKKMCFDRGLRCNRQGLEISSTLNKIG